MSCRSDRNDWSVAVSKLAEHQAAMHAYYTDGQYAENAFQLVQEHARLLMSGEPAKVIVLADERERRR